MIDRFQEAFETIKNSLPPKLVKDSRYKTYKAIATIQELIDQQGDYMSYQDLKAEYEGELQELKDKLKFIEEVQTPDYIRVQNLNEKLELALDKICELSIKQRFGRDYPYIPKDVIKQKEKELKESLLKESEKDNVSTMWR